MAGSPSPYYSYLRTSFLERRYSAVRDGSFFFRGTGAAENDGPENLGVI
jgi:hypothetical protein